MAIEADYKNLIVWQKAILLVTELYCATKVFPKEELFGLTSQMRRAAVSIPSNIAEGSRRLRGERVHFLRIAFGSATELETQLEIANRLNYLEKPESEKLTVLLVEVLKILNKMIHYV